MIQQLKQEIQTNLLDVMKDKTVIVVAHRLSTIARLDRIIIIDQGRIVDEGNHDELVQRSGIYSDYGKDSLA